ncbi:MAG: hypothetical protein N4J56_001779 [Chroococcidiopsis sp. SAG 2025]|nr:hypothetical protein [Chroococcidiopsis sp. SAG 2025]
MPRKVRDLTGQRFGRWMVLQFYDGTRQTNMRQAVWMCRCDCGTVKPVKSQSLTRGVSKSCGCGRVKHDYLRSGRDCGRGNSGNVTPRKDKPVELIQRATTALVDEQQGYAWRTDRAVAHRLTNDRDPKPATSMRTERLEQYPDGLWKYPGYSSTFTPIHDSRIPSGYVPNFIKLHKHTR